MHTSSVGKNWIINEYKLSKTYEDDNECYNYGK